MLAYISCWSLFWIGHYSGKLFEITHIEFFFDIYDLCMNTSVNIQDKHGIENGPWVPIEEDEDLFRK